MVLYADLELAATENIVSFVNWEENAMCIPRGGQETFLKEMMPEVSHEK